MAVLSSFTLLALLLGGSGAVAGAYRDAVLADAPVSFWRLAEVGGLVAVDETGRNPGTYGGGVALNAPGALVVEANAAAAFDGLDDQIVVADSPTLDLTGGVTITAWVKRAKAGTQVLVAKPGTTTSRLENYSLWLGSGNNVKVHFGNGSSYVQVYGPVIDTRWHYLAATYDNATARLYVDGVLTNSKSSALRLTPNDSPLTIGRALSGHSAFGGVLDEVAIYPVALGADRIAANYALALQTDPPPTVTLAAPATGSVSTSGSVSFAGVGGTAADDLASVAVEVYAGEAVAGAPVQTLTAPRADDGSYAASTTLADGTWTARAEQRDSGGNVGRSPPVTFGVDTTPPVTAIASGPADPTSATTATFSFSAGEPATFACSLDGAPFTPCASPQQYAGLAEGLHQLSVRATDAAGNAGAATVRAWRIDLTAPAATIDSGPPALTSAASASFAFSGETGASFGCSLDGAAFAPCSSPHAVSGLADGPHVFDVRATDGAGNTGQAVRHTWTVDTSPPVAAIGSGPVDPTNEPHASFTFSSEDGAALACSLDGAAFSPCSSPRSYSGLGEGGHTFDVRATDAAGNTGVAARRSWRVDLTAPTVVIDSAPSEPTNATSVTFAFSSEAGATFACSLDGAAFAPCTSPRTYDGLAEGAHAFDVRATDAAGNTGSAVRHSWSSDLTGPSATIGSGPADPTNATTASFTFSSEAGASLSCSLDGAPFAACSSPRSYSGLAEGAHTFDVQATDPAANTGPAARHAWTVDTTAPVATIASAPADPTNATAASFTFSTEPGASLACSLDGAPFAPCSSPYSLGGLTEGTHRFDVRAGDAAGNTGPPARHTWTIDLAAPATTIDSAPADPTSSASALFVFSAELGAGFECSLDGTPFLPCASPHSYAGLADGPHVFEVRARDLAGNTGPAARRTWTVDTVAPAASIQSGPADPTNATGATFVFSGETGASFECRLDGAAFAACSSAKSYLGVAEGPHTFDVRARDAAGNAGPAARHSWTVDLTAPSATIQSGPASPTNATGATFVFSSEAGAILACSLDGGPFGACSSPRTYSALAEGPHTFDVRATDAAGNTGAAARHAWTVDLTAPTTAIGSGPADPTNASTATFAFSSEPGVVFACSLDGGAFTSCTSPTSYAGVAEGAHRFDVRATDPAGNVGPAVQRTWTVDLTAPSATVTSGPADPTNATSATFAFTGEAGASFACSLDGAAFAPCTSPRTYDGLAEGAHAFDVRATDAAGNTGPAAGRDWTVDLTPPGAAIDSGPADPTNATSASFTFSSEAGASLSCSLDGAPFAACSSPRSYSGLSEGAHTFDVRASDAAGNTGAAARSTWTVDLTPPATTIDSAPADPTNATSATFLFASEPATTLECSLDGGVFLPCASPQAYAGLAEGPHAFEARARDLAGNTGPAGRHTWTVDLTPPTASIDSGPDDPTSSTAATLAFSSEPGASFECSLDAGAFAPCSSPRSHTGLSEGPHAFEVRARDLAGNTGAAARRTWMVDVTGPVAAITSGPADPTNATSATLAFTGETGASFECSLDGGAFAACSSPQVHTGLAEGPHAFDVRATDAAGNPGPAARHEWTVDLTAPGATIDSGPADPTNATSASFTFSSEAGASLSCSLDGAPFAACSSPRSYSGLAEGAHTFDVRATDPAGNTGPAERRTWTVDTTPPAATITAAPPSPSTATVATFEFAANEASTFACSIDGGAFAACTSPETFAGLGSSLHTFGVRATDAAGNEGATATHTWQIDAVAPVARIDSGPSGLSNQSTATFAFSADKPAAFACSLDGGAFAACTSPKSYPGLAAGPHTFDVNATDGAGTGDTVRWTWTIDLTSPSVQYRSGPELIRTTSTTATFTFISPDDPAATFVCRLDADAYAPCTSPITYSGLALGQHTARVKAIDAAGNHSAEDVSSWLIEAPRPAAPAITAAPAGVTSATSATLAFAPVAGAAGYECGLDGAPPTACASPAALGPLGEGRHSFEVRAVTATGVKGDSSFHRWTVDLTAPAPSLSSGPSDPSGSADATFAFAAPDLHPVALGAALPPLLPESTGTTFYVATDGSDANPGTLAAPWRTVQKALNTLQPGQRALVRAGTYVQNLFTTRSGTPSSPITIEAYPGEEAVLRADTTAVDNYPIEIRDGSYLRLRGFVIEGATGPSTTNVFLAETTHHVEISNNEIRGSTGQGIFTEAATSSAYLIGNHIHDNGSTTNLIQDHGIYTEGADHLVANNVIHDHFDGFGIQVYPRNHGSIVVGNTVVGNGHSGVVVGGSGGVYDIVVRNNVLAFNDEFGLETGTCPIGPVLVDSNVVFGNGFGAVETVCQYIDASAGNVLADPLFVDLTARDLRVRQDSPALDRALSEYALSFDAGGAQRPVGPFADIGALEAARTVECRLDGEPFLPCASPRTFTGLADGTHTFQVRAVDAAGNAGVAARTWRVVTVPPAAPAIEGGPSSPTSATAATFAFSHADAEVSFECRLDGAPFAACTSPRVYAQLEDGSHVFEVRAVGITDLAGASAGYTWVVDTVPPPVPSLVSAPPDPSGSADASFAFTSTGAASFQCSLDEASFAACASPASYAGLTEGTHTFDVRALDAAGNASVATGHAWRVVTVPPAAPAIDGGPPPLTSATAATLAFSHPDPVSFECRLDGAPFAACTSPHSYSSLDDGSHTFDVRAVGVTGLSSGATSRSWTVDTAPPPAPTLVAAPPDPSGYAEATFAFSSTGAASFECSLDAAPPSPCASPRAYAGLSDGDHTFLVRAFDAAGNTSATTHAWTVTTQPPAAPSIDSAPPGATTSTAAAFAFSHPETGVTFECSLDGAAFAACTSPRAYTELADGPHTFGVRARNAVGIASVPAGAAWTVDTQPPPVPAIDSAPPDPSASTSASFAFSSAGAAVFECRLDAAAFEACSSPRSYTGLVDGAHTFQVRALDALGNASAAASRSWTIETAPPATPAITSAPPPQSSSASASFTFAHVDAGVAFECRLDAAAFAACSSPQEYTALAEGQHTFEVRARKTGPASAAASHTWVVDAVATSVPTIGSAPLSPTSSTDASFSFSATDAYGFECRLDGGAFGACPSPQVYTGLALGVHVFEVRAIDQQGARTAAASHAWSIVAAVSYRSEVLADSPRAYWRLGESSGTVAADETGTAPGTYESGVTLGVAGAIVGDANTAARFDGSDDRVNFGDPASGGLDFGTSDFTVEAWVATTVNGERTIVSKKPSSGRHWNVTVTDDPGFAGLVRVTIADASVTRQAYGPATRVDDGAWHHVVVLFDRDVGVTIVVDGVSAATAGPVPGDIGNTAALLVGKATGYGYFRGEIDDVALYPQLLPSTRIQVHYDRGRGR